LLGRTWRKYKDDGVIFLGVNIKDAESDAKRFIADFGITYPMERDVDQQLMRSFVLREIRRRFSSMRAGDSLALNQVLGEASRGNRRLGAITEEQLASSLERLVRSAKSQ
jgi:hypothetical protein